MQDRPPFFLLIRPRPLWSVLACLVLLSGGLSGADSCAADDLKDARKEFRAALIEGDWKDRREAYIGIADYDSAAVVREILIAMGREKNPAVIMTAVGILAGFGSLDAREALVTEVRKSRGTRKMYVLLALTRQDGRDAVPILLETLKDKDPQAAAQAALALGRKEVKEALPQLLVMLKHKDWQLRRAAALALAALAQPPPPKPKPGDENKPPIKWPVPDWIQTTEVTQALVTSLALSKGRERADIVKALEAIHEKPYGLNLAAWKSVLAGEEPDARTLKKRIEPAYVFGIPLYGRRIVFVLDNSLRNGDPHRFGTGAHLRALCEVPGRRPILHMRLLTVGQFARAHYKRAIRDLPKGGKYELIVFNASIHGTFGKFASASSSSRKLSDDVLDSLKPDDGIATYGALNAALDMGGSADSKAWKKGPDEIVFMTCNMPTTGEIKDADVVGAAIALKARLRMVPIHTIGIESHPYGMLETIARETGGVYRNYYE